MFIMSFPPRGGEDRCDRLFDTEIFVASPWERIIFTYLSNVRLGHYGLGCKKKHNTMITPKWLLKISQCHQIVFKFSCLFSSWWFVWIRNPYNFEVNQSDCKVTILLKNLMSQLKRCTYGHFRQVGKTFWGARPPHLCRQLVGLRSIFCLWDLRWVTRKSRV